MISPILFSLSVMFMFACMYIPVYVVPEGTRRSHHIPGTEVTNDCEQPSGCWGWNPDPVWEQWMLWTISPVPSFSPFDISPLAGVNALLQLVLQYPFLDISCVPSILNWTVLIWLLVVGRRVILMYLRAVFPWFVSKREREVWAGWKGEAPAKKSFRGL